MEKLHITTLLQIQTEKNAGLKPNSWYHCFQMPASQTLQCLLILKTPYMLTPDADRLWLSYSHIKMSYMAARLTGLSLCLYCLVRPTGTYFGGGTPYQQFLMSQRWYAVQPVWMTLWIAMHQIRFSSSKCTEICYWMSLRHSHRGGGAYDTPTEVEELTTLPQSWMSLRHSHRAGWAYDTPTELEELTTPPQSWRSLRHPHRAPRGLERRTPHASESTPLPSWSWRLNTADC